MRLYFLLVLAVLVLPLSGCAKKKADSDGVASNNSSDGANSDSEGMDDGMSSDGMDDGMSGDGMDDGMYDDGMGNPGGHGDGMDEGMYDEGMPMDNGMFDEGMGAPGGHDDGMPMDNGMFDEGMGTPGGHDEGMPMDDPDMFNTTPPGDEGMGTPGGHDEGMPMPGADGMPEGDPMFEGMPPGDFPMDGMGGEGDAGRAGAGVGGIPQKPTDIPGVKEDSPEYAAVDFILNVMRGDKDNLKSLIAEDVDGLLKELRSDNPEKALEKAKEMIGKVKPQNTRLDDRDTIVAFKNDKDKILQFYVRRIQGEYVVRDIRERDAVERSPQPRRRRR